MTQRNRPWKTSSALVKQLEPLEGVEICQFLSCNLTEGPLRSGLPQHVVGLNPYLQWETFWGPKPATTTSQVSQSLLNSRPLDWAGDCLAQRKHSYFPPFVQRKHSASHPVAPGSNPGSAEIFSPYCLVCRQYWDQTHLVLSNKQLAVTSRAKYYKNIFLYWNIGGKKHFVRKVDQVIDDGAN